MKKVFFILVILGENYYMDEQPLRVFEPFDPVRNLRPTKRLYKQTFFELGKDKEKLETVNQKYWHDYFTSGEVAADAPEYIRRASEILAVSNLNKKERELMSIMERAIADYDADMADKYWEGFDEGHIDTARKMLDTGFTLEQIMMATGLDLETIEDLQGQMLSRA